jgi:ATP-dependent RNA helicase DeaD
MLAAIERATRQPITAMSLPSRKDISNRRADLFKEQIAEAMESQDLEFFEELIDSYQNQYDVGLRRIAATLAYLVQKDRPLQMEDGVLDEATAPAEGFAYPERDRKTSDANLTRYRIEVGRTHGVEPKHIVGAIANEANLRSRDIGQIKILNDHCLIDLPKDIPSATFRLLQKVWVCGQQLQISPADDRFPTKTEKTKHPKGPRDGEGKTLKPGSKKPRGVVKPGKKTHD